MSRMAEIAMRLEDLDKALAGHDWYFNMSDDGRVYNAGVASWDRLSAEMNDLRGLGFRKEVDELFSKHRPW